MYSETESPPSGSGTGSPAPPVQDEEEVEILAQHELATQVYRSLWRNFYTWENQSYAKQHLDGLSRSLPPLPPPPWRNRHDGEQYHVSTGPSNDNDEFEFEVHDYEPHHVSFNLKQKYRPIRPRQIDMYPRYTACTPLSQTVSLVAIETEEILHFVPLADDPGFETMIKRLIEETKYFLWQIDFKDPDVEVIQLETARRLHFAHNFTFPEIDRFSFLSSALRTSSRSGIIWESRQRDLVPWPELRRDPHQTFPSNFITSTNVAEHVQKGAQAFCSNLNCVRDCCSIHTGWKDKHMLPLRQPTIDIDHMWDAKVLKTPCLNRCYKTCVRDEIEQDVLLWSGTVYEEFRGIVSIAPDAMPCDLAVICRKDCVEVYQARRQWLSNDVEVVEKPEKEVLGADDKKKFEKISDEKVPVESSIGGCSHIGPCNQYADCECFKTGSYCRKSCRCSVGCQIRFAGCTCHTAPKKSDSRRTTLVCNDNSCPCFAALRRCDPETCCPEKSRHSNRLCYSTQYDDQAQVRIAPSEWGLGAFALEDIQKSAMIGAYYGEFYLDIDGPPPWLAPMQNYSGLNYSFRILNQLNSKIAGNVDSWNAGNPTRYLNHKKAGTIASCDSNQVNIYGVETIFVYADRKILKGEELTLDYGVDYWSANNSGP